MSGIFISYSRLDREFVDRLIEALEQRGFDIWVDRKDIGGGNRLACGDQPSDSHLPRFSRRIVAQLV